MLPHRSTQHTQSYIEFISTKVKHSSMQQVKLSVPKEESYDGSLGCSVLVTHRGEWYTFPRQERDWRAEGIIILYRLVVRIIRLDFF